MADNNQHFKTRATTVTKGVFEVGPSESTILAKSLVDIAAMLKEIKEGQKVTQKLLTQQTNTSQQLPVKHCDICSCKSYHTDECPWCQKSLRNSDFHRQVLVTCSEHGKALGLREGHVWAKSGTWSKRGLLLMMLQGSVESRLAHVGNVVQK
ncbi:hypothetical protein PIB30_071416 [Stylosanthes scabra]|uniref:Uncharacterized protein n=1 Tax=Stylosanthes scabra TaxID=79078 RepID=A0ABU6QPK2_9FABA|nr:hypothetical protein [Stylosanthes scabra]